MAFWRMEELDRNEKHHGLHRPHAEPFIAQFFHGAAQRHASRQFRRRHDTSHDTLRAGTPELFPQFWAAPQRRRPQRRPQLGLQADWQAVEASKDVRLFDAEEHRALVVHASVVREPSRRGAAQILRYEGRSNGDPGSADFLKGE